MFAAAFHAKVVEGAILVAAPFPGVVVSIAVVVLRLTLSLSFAFAFSFATSLAALFVLAATFPSFALILGGLLSSLRKLAVVEGQRSLIYRCQSKWSCEIALLSDRIPIAFFKGIFKREAV